jgi:hypothetical protein
MSRARQRIIEDAVLVASLAPVGLGFELAARAFF